MFKYLLLLPLICSLGVNAVTQRNLLGKKTKKTQDSIFDAILANYTRQANITSSNSHHYSGQKHKNVPELYVPESSRKVGPGDEIFQALLNSFARYESQYESLESKQKQIEDEHNTTQQDVQSQFDQISQQMQTYQSKLNDIYKIKDQSNAQMKLFQNTILQIDELIKQRGSVHLSGGEFIKLFNHANRALSVIDKNLQLFCTNQGKGSHTTIQTHLNDDRDGHAYKTTLCSNARVGHIRNTFNRIVAILNESQQETVELSRQEQTKEEEIRMQMEYIIDHQNDIVNETKIKLGALEQEILSLKTNMSQLKKQKRNILKLWESMVDDGNDFVTRRFSHGHEMQTYHIIQFYVDTVLPLLIEQRIRWYVSCYSLRAALSHNPFVALNFTCMKLELFHHSHTYLADKYNASIDLGLKAKDMSSNHLQVLYQRGNEKLRQYMEQIENASKHMGLFVILVKVLLQQIQQQLDLKLHSSTLPITLENMHLIPVIHDWIHTMSAPIECRGFNSSNTSEIVFRNFTYFGDILDARRHMFSFIKKQYDIALYFQKGMDKLKTQTGQDLNMRMNINFLQWYMMRHQPCLLFSKVKAFGIDATDEMMKSVFGLVTYRVEYLKEKYIDSIEFYQHIINKTYINHWQNSTAADEYQDFVSKILPVLAII